MPLDDDIKGWLTKQGEAFEAFKKTHDETIAELKKGVADPLLKDRMGRIEASLDQAVEAKAKTEARLEARLEAEVKEREALELRLSKMGGGLIDGKKAVEIADFNNQIKATAALRKRTVQPVDAAGYDAYKAVQEKLFREGEKALDSVEIKTMSVGSDPDGGYLVTPDMSGRMVKRIYETSPMRQICAQQTISTDRLDGMEDLGEGGAAYAGETVQSGDTTTAQIGKWSITVYTLEVEPRATQQLLDDAAIDVEAWIADKAADKIGRLENAEFVAGGSGRIRGITSYATALDSGSGVAVGSFGHITTGVSGDFAATTKGDKLIDLVGLLKEFYLTNARWLMRRATVTAIRKFKDGEGNYLWQPSFVLGTPETIMAFPVTRAEDMPAMAANSLSLAFGDFKEAYQIVDRQGISVMRDPFTGKPFVKFYTTKRTGGGAINFEAVKFLKFA